MHVLKENGITFFTGVPDSLLSVFCDELANRYGFTRKQHIHMKTSKALGDF